MRLIRRRRAAVRLAVALVAAGLLASCSKTPEERYQAYMESAEGFLEAGDFASADIEYKNALRMQPESADAYSGVAKVRLAEARDRASAGETALWLRALMGAVEALDQATELDPSHKEAAMLSARVMVAAGGKEDMGGVSENLAAALGEARDDPDALLLLAMAKGRQAEGAEDMPAIEELLLESIEQGSDRVLPAQLLARMKLLQGDPEGAETALLDALERAQAKAPIHTTLGEFYRSQERGDEALEQYAAALREDPGYAPALLGRGRQELAAGDQAAAEATFREISQLDGDQPSLAYGQFLLREERFDEAILELERVVEEHPDSHDGRVLLAAVHQRQGRLESALEVLSQRITDEPRDVRALQARAQLYLSAFMLGEAESDLQTILEQRPASDPARFLLSRVHLARGASELRRTTLETLVEMSPLHIEGRLELAQMAIQRGAPKDAVDLLAQIPAPRQSNRRVRAALITAQIADKQYDAARETLKLAQEDSSGEFDFLTGVLRQTEGDLAGAAKATEAALEADPSHTRALTLLASIISRRESQASAVERVQRHAEEHADLAPVQLVAGELLARAGNEQKAREALVRALGSNGQNHPAELALARLDLFAGKFDEARKWLDGALERQPRAPDALLVKGMLHTQQAKSQWREFQLAVAANDLTTMIAKMAMAKLEQRPGSFEDSDEAARMLVSADAGSPRSEAVQAKLEAWKAEIDSAVETYRGLLAVTPNNISALNNLADHLSVHYGKLDEALEYSEKAKELAPSSAAVDGTLGWIYYLKGIPDVAIGHLRRSAELNPRIAQVQYYLAITQSKLGNNGAAQAALSAAEELDPNGPERGAARRALGL